MEKYRTFVRLEQIREHVRNKEYELAYIPATEINVHKLKEFTDITMLVDVFSACGDHVRTKECLLEQYSRSATRTVLMQLINLSIRLREAAEAETYYKQYSELVHDDFYSIIFRYSIDKLENKPYETLIGSLRSLKELEYIEEWGYELAKLYYKSGDMSACEAECNDLITWFGCGEYVDRAKALKAYCNGELDIEALQRAAEERRAAYAAARRAEEAGEAGAAGTAGSEDEMPGAGTEQDVQYGLSEGTEYELGDLLVTAAMQVATEPAAESVAAAELVAASAEAEQAAATQTVKATPAAAEQAAATPAAAEAELAEPEDTSAEMAAAAAAESETVAAGGSTLQEELEGQEETEPGSEKSGDGWADGLQGSLADELDRVEKPEREEEEQLEKLELPEGLELAASQEEEDESEQEDNLGYILSAVGRDKDHKNSALYGLDEDDSATSIDDILSGSLRDFMESFSDERRDDYRLLAPSELKEELPGCIKYVFTAEDTYPIGPETRLGEFLAKNNAQAEDYFGFFAYCPGVRSQLIKASEILLNPQIKNTCIAISGGPGSGKTSLVKGLTRMLFKAGFLQEKTCAMTDARKVNTMDIRHRIDKLMGKCLVIENAGKLTPEAAERLNECNSLFAGHTAVMICDSKPELSNLFRACRDLSGMFPVRIHIPEVEESDMCDLVHMVLKNGHYAMTEEAEDELKKVIAGIVRKDRQNALRRADELAHAIIDRVDLRGARGFISETLAGKIPRRENVVLAEDVSFE